jgi:hypothetical protein
VVTEEEEGTMAIAAGEEGGVHRVHVVLDSTSARGVGLGHPLRRVVLSQAVGELWLDVPALSLDVTH